MSCARLTEQLTTYPEDFHIHPKVKKLLEQRAEMGNGQTSGGLRHGARLWPSRSLVKAGMPVRMSADRTAAAARSISGIRCCSISRMSRSTCRCRIFPPDQARCEIYNSTLSEAGVLGFEYGYSRDYPEALVMWEAQFGDFANVAQAVIDQFVSAGEDKWRLLSGVVLLLPHGYEGQGPEHSSARIERFLQLAARDNFQICQPSNAAQYFHLLRRQALRTGENRWWCLRRRACCGIRMRLRRSRTLRSHASWTWCRTRKPVTRKRVLLCTGKIGHELRAERKRRKDTSTAIVFLDQLYPFPEARIERPSWSVTPSARDIVWVQEEPANMGALFYMLPRLRNMAGERSVLSVKRSASASPATGSAKAHEMEQKTLFSLAFTTSR